MPVFTQAKPRGIKTLFPFRANMHPPPLGSSYLFVAFGTLPKEG